VNGKNINYITINRMASFQYNNGANNDNYDLYNELTRVWLQSK